MYRGPSLVKPPDPKICPLLEVGPNAFGQKMVYKTTAKKLLADLDAGVGSGTGDDYEPWIKVTKKNTSARSNQSIAKVPGLKRLCHFLSRGEKDLSHTLWWIGAADVREQYPLFPWEHSHPRSQVDATQDWGLHPGVQAIAKDAGICLPVYPRIQIPIVLTLDLVATSRWPDGTCRGLVGFSCKAKSEYLREDQPPWFRERLELDRRYCTVGAIPHLLVHPERLPGRLPRELEALAPHATLEEMRAIRASARYLRFVECLERWAYVMPACIAANVAGRRVGWTHEEAGIYLRMAMWCQDVDVDLSERTNMAAPLVRGGRELRQQLRRTLLGEANDA